MLETMTEREPEALKALIEELSNPQAKTPGRSRACRTLAMPPCRQPGIGQAIAVDGGYTVK